MSGRGPNAASARPRPAHAAACLAAFMVAGLVPTAAAQRARREPPAELRLLPVGDSITQGGQGHASWRYPLWFLLSPAARIDFVGTRTTVFGGDGGANPDTGLYPQYYTGFDRDHEGWWGFRTDQIAELAFAASSAARPDLVLIHLGTNDVGQMGAAGVANAALYLPRILEEVRAARPAAVFFLAQVIPIGPGTSYFANAGQIPALNQALAQIAADEDRPSSPVVLVDQFDAFSLANDMQPDGLHPDVSGEDRIALRWLDALRGRLHAPRPPAHPAPAIEDQSFEALGLADGVVAERPAGIAWGFGATPGTFRGVFNPGAETYSGAAGAGAPAGAEGDEVAYLYDNGGADEEVVLYQTLKTTLEPERLYTLVVAVGNRLPTNPYGPSTWGGFRIELLAGSEVLSSVVDAFTPVAGTFQDAVLVFSSAGLAPERSGGALTIRMGLTEQVPGSATDFDDVRLTVE